jgi:hypothetical protein
MYYHRISVQKHNLLLKMAYKGFENNSNKNKLRGLSPQENYTERPPLVGVVSAISCG